MIAVLLAYVVPQVVSVYQQSRQTLPWLTQALIAVSALLPRDVVGVACGDRDRRVRVRARQPAARRFARAGMRRCCAPRRSADW